jgi:hypothetical protein
MKESNRWKGFVIGMIGSAAGLAAMRAYWQQVAPWVRENVNLGGREIYPDVVDLDDISVVGQQAQGDESSTAALGRMMYEMVAGTEPQNQKIKDLLSYLVHWGYGILQGGLYGAWNAGNGRRPTLKSGAAFGTGLWLLGDELIVPALGLQEGPTAVAPNAHLNRWGAHLAYGLATAVTSRFLQKVL